LLTTVGVLALGEALGSSVGGAAGKVHRTRRAPESTVFLARRTRRSSLPSAMPPSRCAPCSATASVAALDEAAAP